MEFPSSHWIGRTTRSYGETVPVGMYVQVEMDESGTGWHIWINEKDPRRGPNEGWDIWADTTDDVEHWIDGVLKVEWVVT